MIDWDEPPRSGADVDMIESEHDGHNTVVHFSLCHCITWDIT